MNRLALALLLSFTLACASQDQRGQWPGSGCAAVDDDRSATFESGSGVGILSIDGLVLGGRYKGAKLCPGNHTFRFVVAAAEFGLQTEGTGEVDFQAGHAYRIAADLCYWCVPRRWVAWVDDMTTGKVVWGKRRDWPSWWL